MYPTVLIDAELCQTCTVCQALKVCRTRAIVQFEPGDLPVIEHSRCRGCMMCVAACPHQAIKCPAQVVTAPQAR